MIQTHTLTALELMRCEYLCMTLDYKDRLEISFIFHLPCYLTGSLSEFLGFIVVVGIAPTSQVMGL